MARNASSIFAGPALLLTAGILAHGTPATPSNAPAAERPQAVAGRGPAQAPPPVAGRGRGRVFDREAIARARTVFEPTCGFCHGNVIHYRVLPEGALASGYGGGAEHGVGGVGAALRAIDPPTGKLRWIHRYPGADATAPRPESLGGLLTTAGGLLFGGGPSGHLIAFHPSDGKILWHSGLLQPMSNTPITYMLDGTQYVVAAAGDVVYAFSLQR